MEWLLMLAILALPVIRFMLLPARVVGAVRRLPLGQIALLSLGLIALWIVLGALNAPRESTGRYMRGDAEMRKLLE